MNPAPITAGDETEFLQRLQAGDEGAWSELTSQIGPRLFSYLRRNLPTIDDTEDVLSETLMASVRAVKSFDGGVPLSAFLFAIAYRKMADFWRKHSAVSELNETHRTNDAVNRRLEFEEVMDSLPELTRQVLLLRYHVGLSVSEVAVVIDRSYKGTESLLNRARIQLRQALTEAGFGDE